MSRPRFKPGLPTIPEDEEYVNLEVTPVEDSDDSEDMLIESWMETILFSELEKIRRRASEGMDDSSDEDVVITASNENIPCSELKAVEYDHEVATEVAASRQEEAQGSSALLMLMTAIVDWFVKALGSLFSCLFPCCFFAPEPVEEAVTENTPLLTT